MSARLRRQIVVESEAGAVFEVISDPGRYPEFFHGLTRWKLLSDEPGPGARYRVLMKVGAIEAGGTVVVTAWDEDRRIAWKHEQGIHQHGSWQLTPAEDGTEVTLEIGFDLSGGLAGKLVEHLAGRIVARNMRAALLGLRRLAESPRATLTG